MADMEMVKFEAAVEKHCAEWLGDVGKLLDQCHAAVTARCHVLRQRVAAVPVPQQTDPKDLAKIPDRINELLAQQSSDLQGIVELKLSAKIDVKSRKLTCDGFGMSGSLTKL
jgi:hypothetical protein